MIASGEQSFIEMMIKDTIKPGKYQTITPCFREESEYSDKTRPWFMKLELCQILQNQSDIEKNISSMITEVSKFLNDNLGDIYLTHTNIGCDLYYDDIELGSYGYRQAGQYHYIYGTGLAEPRFSIAKELEREKSIKNYSEEYISEKDEDYLRELRKLWK